MARIAFRAAVRLRASYQEQRGEMAWGFLANEDEMDKVMHVELSTLGPLCRKIGERASPEVMWSQLTMDGQVTGEMDDEMRMALAAFGLCHHSLTTLDQKFEAEFQKALEAKPATRKVDVTETILEPVAGTFEKTM